MRNSFRLNKRTVVEASLSGAALILSFFLLLSSYGHIRLTEESVLNQLGISRAEVSKLDRMPAF